uniref:EGF-like domain-containing protein n=1 Tax=Anopheles minimus TaxID=112268 RepID=A0A182VZG5_9DIPT
MIFGDLVCCVHFVVLLQSCIGALVAPPTVGTTALVAAPLVRQPPSGGTPPTNRSGRYTETLPGELNEYCRASQDCRPNAHVCDTRKQTCDCAEGYRPDEAGRMCLGAVGRRCLYDSHCITNAYCKGQMICTCKREYGFLADDNWSCQASSGRPSSRNRPVGVQLTLLLVAVSVSALTTWWTDARMHTALLWE